MTAANNRQVSGNVSRGLFFYSEVAFEVESVIPKKQISCGGAKLARNDARNSPCPNMICLLGNIAQLAIAYWMPSQARQI